MNHLRIVRRLHRLRESLDQFRSLDWFEGSAIEFAIERTTRAELQNEIRLSLVRAYVVDLHDVAMPQARDCLRLSAETHQIFLARMPPREDHLDGHGAIQMRVFCQIHHTHTTAVEFALVLV